MNLIEISDNHKRIHDLIIENGGELTPELEEILAISSDELEQKLEGYYFTIKTLEKDAELFRDEGNKLIKVARGLENSIERLKTNIELAMGVLGKEEIECGLVKLKYVKGKASVVIEDMKALPLEFKEVIVKPMLSKIYDCMKLIPIPGAKLEENKYLKFFSNNGRKK